MRASAEILLHVLWKRTLEQLLKVTKTSEMENCESIEFVNTSSNCVYKIPSERCGDAHLFHEW